MIELILCLCLAALGGAERVWSGRRHNAERDRLLNIVLAQRVSPGTAAAVAVKGSEPAPKPEPEKRPVQLIDL